MAEKFHNSLPPTVHDFNCENMTLSLLLPEPPYGNDFHFEEDGLHPFMLKTPSPEDEIYESPPPSVDYAKVEGGKKISLHQLTELLKEFEGGNKISVPLLTEFLKEFEGAKKLTVPQLTEFLKGIVGAEEKISAPLQTGLPADPAPSTRQVVLPIASEIQHDAESLPSCPVPEIEGAKKKIPAPLQTGIQMEIEGAKKKVPAPLQTEIQMEIEGAKKKIPAPLQTGIQTGEDTPRREVSTERRADKARKDKYLDSSESRRTKSHSQKKKKEIPTRYRLETSSKSQPSDDLEVKEKRRHGKEKRHRHRSSRERGSEMRSRSSDVYERRHASNIERLSEFQMASGSHSRSKMSESKRTVSEPDAESSEVHFVSRIRQIRQQDATATYRAARVSPPKQTLEPEKNPKECLTISELERGEKSSKRKNSYELIEPKKEPEEVLECPKPKEAVASKQSVTVKIEHFDEEDDEEEGEVEDDEDYNRFLRRYKKEQKARKERKNSDSSDHDSDRSASRRDVKREIKPDPDFIEDESLGFDRYYCKVCQLTLNSECTYKSHMLGKRHKKALSSQRIPEIAKAGLMSVMQSQEAYQQIKDPAPSTRQVVLPIASEIQHDAESLPSCPVPGLNYVVEIRAAKEINYYCEICGAKCSPASILAHLVGFKHYLNCIKNIEPAFYNINKERPKKEIVHKVRDILFRDERRNGRGKIKVVKEVTDLESPSPFYDEPGPSWRTPSLPPLPYGRKGEVKSEGDIVEGNDQPSGEFEEYLDTSKNDYHCTLCDVHMNNVNMWQAHIIGKRHAKNKKKTPAGMVHGFPEKSKNRTVKAPPHVTSCLEKMVEDMHEEIIVGLDFIRETQAENGEMYNCYLCGAGCTSDIIDHLLTLKHRIKYLEKVNASGQFPNGIKHISELEINLSYRESLVTEECAKIEKEYGRGKVEIYLAKH